ncbi:NADPH:quinone reductase [Streptomyces tateyamensis]|uniref:NADPH:quinone reductase n=1 Tax=Streptomyces tateyamensis TaxID=565073 RepID=A0A2V4P9L3_9ACTN|nr:NADP-dependent oxidoreductase [Streptomyces tateyamensis]PYC87421.1 NADPH:quinone reductase [Streptomyces tateyamensis]
MFAVTFARYGDPSVLEVAEVPAPQAGPGQVRIAVQAAAVNGYDWKLRAGYLQEIAPVAFPAVPGLEAAGVVDQVGDGVLGVAVGDKVFGLGQRTWAQYALLDHFAAKPVGLGWPEAGGLSVVAETAQRCLDLLGARAGQTLLVDGAAGGVGSTVAQFAKAAGLTVVGTASEANHAYLRTLGVLPTVYGPGLAQRVAELAPQGVDLALDTAGRGSVPELVAITGAPDQVLTIADFSAAQYGVRTTSRSSAFGALAKVADLVAAEEFALRVDSVYPLDRAAGAHQHSEHGHPAGKVVLSLTEE